MKKIALTVGFFVGLATSVAVGFYLLGMLLYVFQPQGEEVFMPAVAYTPRWIFLFAPLVLLGGTKEAKEGINWISAFMGA